MSFMRVPSGHWVPRRAPVAVRAKPMPMYQTLASSRVGLKSLWFGSCWFRRIFREVAAVANMPMMKVANPATSMPKPV